MSSNFRKGQIVSIGHTVVPPVYAPASASHTPVALAYAPVPMAYAPVATTHTPVAASHTPAPLAYAPVGVSGEPASTTGASVLIICTTKRTVYCNPRTPSFILFTSYITHSLTIKNLHYANLC